jgi:hypothetical protein
MEHLYEEIVGANLTPTIALFEVVATFPMEKLRAGVVREGPPFDVEEFVRQIGAQT